MLVLDESTGTDGDDGATDHVSFSEKFCTRSLPYYSVKQKYFL